MKRCIFYLPYELDRSAARARMVRPRKMIRAFQDIGYDVFEITGYAAERKRKIAEAKRLIRSGVPFDFTYSEASTMPTLLTEPHHFPTHPFLDFGFFRYLKRHGIPIGLFYPDIYWKFDNYGKELPVWKRLSALKNYELDIREYEKLLDRFYTPNKKACDYLGSERLTSIAEELPPGADDLTVSPRSYEARDFDREPLTVFYVGGLGNQYQLGDLIAAVAQTPRTKLILCCREAEWEKEKASFEPYLNERIEVVHKSGEELEPYYATADLGSLLFSKGVYIGLARPVKAYEYLAHELPVLATEGTASGDYVKEAGIGWTIEYSAKAIAEQLQSCIEQPALLAEKRQRCKEVKPQHTWKARAGQVAQGLKNDR